MTPETYADELISWEKEQIKAKHESLRLLNKSKEQKIQEMLYYKLSENKRKKLRAERMSNKLSKYF